MTCFDLLRACSALSVFLGFHRIIAVLLIFVSVLGLEVATPSVAKAQTNSDIVLVSNTAEMKSVEGFPSEYASAFTTGSNSSGYTIVNAGI